MAKAISKGRGKKKWFPIIAPKMFHEKVIGESLLYESESAVGRFVKVNLMSITNDMKNQNAEVRFQITGVSDGRLKTKITDYEIIPTALKRLIRRRQNRVDDSFTTKTADGLKLRIKPLITTRGKTSISVISNIRKKVKEELTKIISSTNYDNVFSNIVFKKTQKAIREKIVKVFPIKQCEIRVLQMCSEKKKEDKKTKPLPAKKAEPKEDKKPKEEKKEKSKPAKKKSAEKENLKKEDKKEKKSSKNKETKEKK